MRLKSVDSDMLFPTPIWYAEYEDYKNVNDAILEEISKVDWDAQHANWGLAETVEERHYEDTFLTLELVPSVSAIVEAFGKHCAEIARVLEWDVKANDLYITELWAHITPPGKNTQTHDHFPAHLSCAYWLRTPEGCGNLRFLDDRKHRMLEPKKSITVEVPAKEGNMVIFPAWMSHYVEENRATETRVSISMNAKLKPKHTEVLGIKIDVEQPPASTSAIL